VELDKDESEEVVALSVTVVAAKKMVSSQAAEISIVATYSENDPTLSFDE